MDALVCVIETIEAINRLGTELSKNWVSNEMRIKYYPNKMNFAELDPIKSFNELETGIYCLSLLDGRSFIIILLVDTIVVSKGTEIRDFYFDYSNN